MYDRATALERARARARRLSARPRMEESDAATQTDKPSGSGERQTPRKDDPEEDPPTLKARFFCTRCHRQFGTGFAEGEPCMFCTGKRDSEGAGQPSGTLAVGG